MGESAALATIVRLKAEVEIDAQALDARALEAASLLAGEMGRELLIVLAVNIHGYYTALETTAQTVEQGRRVERIHPRVQTSLRGFVEHLNATIDAIIE